jgi:hypothetical protein
VVPCHVRSVGSVGVIGRLRPLGAVFPVGTDFFQTPAFGLRSEPVHEHEPGHSQHAENREGPGAAELLSCCSNVRKNAATMTLATRSEVSIALDPSERAL